MRSPYCARFLAASQIQTPISESPPAKFSPTAPYVVLQLSALFLQDPIHAFVVMFLSRDAFWSGHIASLIRLSSCVVHLHPSPSLT